MPLIPYDPVLVKLAAGASLDVVLTALARVAEDTRPHMICSILLLDADGRHLRHGAAPSLHPEYNAAIDGVEIGPDVGSCGRAAHLRERVVVSDISTAPSWKPYREIAEKFGLRACWSQPVFSSANEILGTLALYYREPRDPDAEDLEFIETAARLAGIAIELERSREELESQVARRTCDLERSSHDLQEKSQLLQTLIDLLPSRIFVKDRESRFLLSNKAHQERMGVKHSEDIIGKTTFEFLPSEKAKRTLDDDIRVLYTGEPQINREVSDDLSGDKECFLTTKVPWRDPQGKIVGLVGVSHDITERKQAEESLEHVAEELRRRNEQMEEDLRMAREIQQACLPYPYPRFPEGVPEDESLFRFGHLYRPTTSLAGDFFDILAISETQVGVLICDVMGHGIRAALITAFLRGIVEELLSIAGQPGAFLVEVNKGLSTILRQSGAPLFVTAFYLVMDADTRMIHYAGAGHPSPIRVTRHDGHVETLCAADRGFEPALGLIPDFAYSASSTPIEAGDRVVLYTDGVFQIGPDGAFEESHLLNTVKRRASAPPETLFQSLLTEIQTVSGAREFSDDICLLSVELNSS